MRSSKNSSKSSRTRARRSCSPRKWPASGVAHEINTPIGSIRSNSDLMMRAHEYRHGQSSPNAIERSKEWKIPSRQSSSSSTTRIWW
ncbi:MAG: hypothetical protein E2P02_26240 [Acidobacteria bacterium]|nr:MAG: hypothetical protein E2P02_26240 [Acidobacteriota bacterium]